MMKQAATILLLGSVVVRTVLAQPRLGVVEGLKLNLGKVDRGTVAIGRLTLKNSGDQKLILGGIEASCGCTVTALSKKELMPGDTASLHIAFHSSTFAGPVHKSLAIRSNAADAPSTTIDVIATVVEDLSFSPAWFHFKDAEAGHQSMAGVKVKNESNKNLKITGFRTQLPHFILTYPRNPFAPGSTVDLIARFTPQSAVPVLGDSVIVTTSSRIQPELSIRVFTTVKKMK